MFDGQLKFPCLKKDEKISAQKSAIKEALKKLSKNITNEDVANLLTQIGLLADHMVAQAKDTVAGMEPYSFKVQLGNGPQTVAYYELMFDAELEKVERCFVGEKSNKLQNVLKRANPDLFKRIYKQFLSIATFTFLINELKLNKEEFFQRYSSTDGGQTYELKKSYFRMIYDNEERIKDHHNAKNAKKICGWFADFSICPIYYCVCQTQMCCHALGGCGGEFPPSPSFDEGKCSDCIAFQLGCFATSLCWAPTFGVLAAPIFGIAAVVGSCVGCCQSSKLKKKQHKLNRLSEAQDELISKKAGKSHLN
ncbi:hypothetical protein GPALN_004839 [Globodera pallida]|nr:hypothetical protein GPALN_004839 [Globodera pallida]